MIALKPQTTRVREGGAPELLLASPRSRWRSAAAIAIILAGAAFLARALVQSREELVQLSIRLSPLKLAGSLVFLLLCFAHQPLMWQRILQDFRQRLSYRDAFAIYYVTALAKYVPGSVWAYVGMAHYGKRANLSAGTTVFSTLVQQAVICGGSVLVFGATLLLWPQVGWTRWVAAATWTLGVVGLLSALPKRALSIIAARLLGQTAEVQFTRTAIIIALTYFMASWVFFAIGYYWLLDGIYPSSWKATIIYSGIYAISWLAGFLAVVSPSGLGIREGVQAYLLSIFVPPSVAVTIALLQRVWLTVGDLLAGLISAWLLKRMR